MQAFGHVLVAWNASERMRVCMHLRMLLGVSWMEWTSSSLLWLQLLLMMLLLLLMMMMHSHR